MKKLFYTLLIVIFACSGTSMHAMKRKNDDTASNNTALTLYNQEQSDGLCLPSDVITRIASYCWPKEKNILMRLSQAFCKCLKDRTAILCANPLTVGISDKIEELIKYTRLGNTQMMSLLFKSGVQANCLNLLGITPFHVASENAQIEAMQLLVEHNANVHYFKLQVHPLHEAAYKGDIKVVQALIAHKVDPKCTIIQYNITALSIASAKGHTEIVKLLLEAGVYVNHARYDGATSLLMASQYNHAEIVKMLLAFGAAINQVDNNGWSSLTLASKNGHTEIVKMLLEAGANVNQAKNNGWTSLMIASHEGHAEIVKLLLVAGANANQVSNQGSSSLMIASEKGHTETVRLLLAAGANVNQVNNNGATSLVAASHNGHTETVKLLLAAHVTVNKGMNNNDCHKAFDIAHQKGHVAIVKLFQSMVQRLVAMKRLEMKQDAGARATNQKDLQQNLKDFIDWLPDKLNKK